VDAGTFCTVLRRLKAAGLRPTPQRLGLARLLLDGHPQHVAAEQLHAKARAAGLRVSLATVYNTLHQFAAAGILRRVVTDTRHTFFDTNTSNHHHFFDERRAEVRDIPAGEVAFARLPAPPAGYEVAGVEVIVRLRPRPVPRR
jgi:Fur family iron response transcriptional regulator